MAVLHKFYCIVAYSEVTTALSVPSADGKIVFPFLIISYFFIFIFLFLYTSSELLGFDRYKYTAYASARKSEIRCTFHLISQTDSMELSLLLSNVVASLFSDEIHIPEYLFV